MALYLIKMKTSEICYLYLFGFVRGLVSMFIATALCVYAQIHYISFYWANRLPTQ